MPHTITEPAARTAGVHDDVDPRGDVDLLAAYVAGDRAAFDEIDRRHRHVLRRVAAGVLDNRVDVDDAVQEALLRALGGAAGFRGEAKVATWLCGITKYVAFAMWREKYHTTHDLALTSTIADTLAADAPELHETGTGLSVGREADLAAAARRRAALPGLLATLSPKLRAAVELVYREGLDARAAGVELGIPYNTAKGRCYRACPDGRHRPRPRPGLTPHRSPGSERAERSGSGARGRPATDSRLPTFFFGNDKDLSHGDHRHHSHFPADQHGSRGVVRRAGLDRTTDGDWPRCCECGDYSAHPECQPDTPVR